MHVYNAQLLYVTKEMFDLNTICCKNFNPPTKLKKDSP